MNGFVVNVQFYLDIIWNQTLYDYNTIWGQIYEQFIELADLNLNCKVCQKIIDKAENSISELVLVITFEFNAKCDYGSPLAKVADMRGKMIKIHINGSVVLTIMQSTLRSIQRK
ncbi:MAG: hypothetical protein AB2693_29505 [Candidatus Thiodiazotropha sp.]